MASIARRLVIFVALAVLLALALFGAPDSTPAQSTATAAAVPPTNTAVPPTDTPTPTIPPTETSAPTEPPTPPPMTTPEPTIAAANHTASITPLRGTVNSWVTFTLANFPPNAPVTIRWQRNSGTIFEFATTTTDGNGSATGQFRVPAVTGGDNQIIHFTSGTVSKRVYFDVRPRIKVLTNPAVCGQQAEVSLRGYAKQEAVRIRWKVGDSWVQVGTVTTSNTGSANILVTVPASASDGLNSVRGDGTVFRQQTNAAVVECG